MSNDNGNMPIYPAQEVGPSGTPSHQMLYGLSKREEFASRQMAAMQSASGQIVDGPGNIHHMAKIALMQADALLAAIEDDAQ